MTVRPTTLSTDGDEAAVTWWLALADRYPLLDVHTEAELGRLARLGSQRARDTLVQHNLRLAVKMARETWQKRRAYLDGCLTVADLIQAANEGLLRAVEDYDERIARFTTHASWWIWQRVSREVATHEHALRLPESFRGEERWDARSRVLSLDVEPPLRVQNSAEEGITWAALLADGTVDVAAEAEANETEAAIDVVLRRLLTPRELQVFTLYDPPDGPTFAEIGDLLGCSRQRAQQARSRALVKLRTALDPYRQQLGYGVRVPAAAAKTKAPKTPTKKSA